MKIGLVLIFEGSMHICQWSTISLLPKALNLNTECIIAHYREGKCGDNAKPGHPTSDLT